MDLNRLNNTNRITKLQNGINALTNYIVIDNENADRKIEFIINEFNIDRHKIKRVEKILKDRIKELKEVRIYKKTIENLVLNELMELTNKELIELKDKIL